jgi:hypothetical protein
MERTSVRGARRRPLLVMAALALLLVAVAIASTGAVPSGTGGSRRPADAFIDAIVSLYLLAMLIGIGLWAYILLVRKDAIVMARDQRARRSPWVTFATLALGFGVLAIFLRLLSTNERLRQRIAGLHPGGRGSAKGDIGEAGSYDPKFATVAVGIVVALAAVALAAWLLSERSRRRRREPVAESLLPLLADVLEETLDDIRAEQDPRRAVIAAYARMERALAAYGLPRAPAEAPDEYLQRIFSDLDVSRRATSRLTALFSWAKFSGHDVAPEMKQEAIEALEAVQDELRAAEILAEEQRLQALAERRERAGAGT